MLLVDEANFAVHLLDLRQHGPGELLLGAGSIYSEFVLLALLEVADLPFELQLQLGHVADVLGKLDGPLHRRRHGLLDQLPDLYDLKIFINFIFLKLSIAHQFIDFRDAPVQPGDLTSERVLGVAELLLGGGQLCLELVVRLTHGRHGKRQTVHFLRNLLPALKA